MPTWVWVLLVLTAVGLALRLLNREIGPEESERLGRAVTILFILALIAGFIFVFLNMDWQ